MDRRIRNYRNFVNSEKMRGALKRASHCFFEFTKFENLAHAFTWIGACVYMDRRMRLHGQAHAFTWTGAYVCMDRRIRLDGINKLQQ